MTAFRRIPETDSVRSRGDPVAAVGSNGANASSMVRGKTCWLVTWRLPVDDAEIRIGRRTFVQVQCMKLFPSRRPVKTG